MKKPQEKLFVQTTPGLMEMKTGGGCIGCFGIPFFGAGIFMLLAVLQIIPFSNAGELPWWSWIILAFMGIVFTGVGAGLVFGRSWVSIDRSAKRVWKAWGLLRPMRGQQFDISEFTLLVISYKAGDSETAESFPLNLKNNASGREMELSSFNSYVTALEQAKLLCGFLNLKLEDRTSDHPVVVTQDVLSSETTPLLHEKTLEIAPLPERMKSEVIEENDTMQIRMRGPAFSPFHLIGLLIPILIVIFIGNPMLEFFVRSKTPAVIGWFFTGFVGLFFVLLPVIEVTRALIMSRRHATVIEVNSAGISVEQRSLSRSNKLHIKADDILGLDYGTKESATNSVLDGISGFDKRHTKMGGISSPHASPPWWMSLLIRHARSKGIVIKSRQGMFYYGAGLPDEEVYYLYTLVRYYLQPAVKKT
jgi:hypothetical protein